MIQVIFIVKDYKDKKMENYIVNLLEIKIGKW